MVSRMSEGGRSRPWPKRSSRPYFRWRVGIATTLAAGIGGLVLLAVGAAVLSGFFSARDNTRELLLDKGRSIIDAGIARVDRQLGPVRRLANALAESVAAGRIDVTDTRTLEAYFAGMSDAAPQITGIGLLTPDGHLQRYLRGERRLVGDDGVDQELRKDVAASGGWLSGPTWGELIHPLTLKDTAINLRVPLRREGRYLGLATFVVAVSDLSLELSRDAGPGHVAYILYDRHWVLAHPFLVNWQPMVSGPVPLARIEDLGDPVLSEVWSDDRYQNFLIKSARDDGGSDNGDSIEAIDIGDRTFIFLHRTLTEYGERPWTVGTYVDARTESVVISRLQRTALVGVALVVLSVIAIVVAARKLSAPIQRLAEAAVLVRKGALDSVPSLRHSRLTEIDEAAGAFNGMVAGLRERERIRALFGKYVPEEVAAALLSQGGELTPTTVEATMLFADMEGFTRLSESIEPGRLVEMLNQYFSVLVHIVESHGGVVTQFQGDGILATFNVPIPGADHAAEAVRAARRILAVLEVRHFSGHWLKCRIGVNTGVVTAGAVGAAGRLSYTVHGDAVNLAARLEVMNKDFGTRLLIAESTARHLDAAEFPLQAMGNVPVRGKSRAVAVYSLNAG